MNIIKLFFLVVMLCLPVISSGEMSSELLELSERWAEIKYGTAENERVQALEKLAAEAERLVIADPDRAEPLIWQAVIVSTLAGEKGGFGALSLVKQAKKLLERAEIIDPDALDGSIYTSLGSLYYQVPGWPIGFGSDDKARDYLLKALAVNPTGMDPNFFYGDFLFQSKQYPSAVEAFEKALQATPRIHRPLADAGRMAEIETALAKAREQLK